MSLTACQPQPLPLLERQPHQQPATKISQHDGPNTGERPFTKVHQSLGPPRVKICVRPSDRLDTMSLYPVNHSSYSSPTHHDPFVCAHPQWTTTQGKKVLIHPICQGAVIVCLLSPTSQPACLILLHRFQEFFRVPRGKGSINLARFKSLFCNPSSPPPLCSLPQNKSELVIPPREREYTPPEHRGCDFRSEVR